MRNKLFVYRTGGLKYGQSDANLVFNDLDDYCDYKSMD